MSSICYLRAGEICVAVAGFVSGIIVSAALALPVDAYYLSNFQFYALSQAAVLALLLPFKPKPQVLGGAALALAAYLAAFGAWMFSRQHPDSMAWIGYVSSLTGGLVGGYLAVYWSRFRSATLVVAVGVAAAITLAGLLINQLVICSTLMYCLGK